MGRINSRLQKVLPLQLIQAATQPFEEAGTYAQVAQHAGHWFQQHLVQPLNKI